MNNFCTLTYGCSKKLVTRALRRSKVIKFQLQKMGANFPEIHVHSCKNLSCLQAYMFFENKFCLFG